MHINTSVTESVDRRDWLITVSSRPASTYVLSSATAHEAFVIALRYRTPGVEEFIAIAEMDVYECANP